MQVEDRIPTINQFTFAVVFVPRVHTVLNPIAHQGVVNTHVAVAEECTG